MRILLTGSSGWLGRVLAPRLVSAGHGVIGLDVAPGAATQVVGSVVDKELVRRTVLDLRIEAIIHAGALHKPDIVHHARQDFVDVNVTGTLNLLEAATEAGHDRFVFTSTTSLMISQAIRDEQHSAAVWLDETAGPLEPRNIYGVTKLAAEGLCRLHFLEHGLNCIVLRTARFFPEEDDTLVGTPGPNLKADEFLYRRLTVEDAARAHLVALEKAPDIGFDTFIISALTPFERSDAAALKEDAASVIKRHFPEADDLYAQRGWKLPASIGRVYDANHAARVLGFTCRTDFAAVLEALRSGGALPFIHEPNYISPRRANALPGRHLT